MKTIYSVLLMLIGIIMPASAETTKGTTTLSGKVIDATDSSALIGVYVYIPDLKEGAVTNEQGCYEINNLPMIRTSVQVSYIGHQTLIRNINLKEQNRADFVMKESNASINEVVVTGITGNALMKNSPSPISIVTERELQGRSSTNIIDAIAHQPGISQITTGSGISKPVIRGLGYNRIVVVNDGIRQEGQQWGDEHGIEIDPQTVHSAEILKGPASLMYGSDAMAGVIIFHDEPVLAQGDMRAGVASEYQTNNGLFNYSLNMEGNRGGIIWDWRYSEKMAHDYKNRYDGYVYNSRFHERALSGMIGINRNWGYSHLILDYYHLTPGIIEGDRDETTGAFVKPVAVDGKETEAIVNSDDNKKYGKDYPYQQVYHYKAVWDNTLMLGDGSLKAIVGYQQNRRKEFEDVLTPGQCGLDFMLHTINYDVHYLTPEMGGWKTATGINGMFQQSLNKGSEYLIPAYRLFDIGIFATTSRDFGRWSFNGGIRYDSRHIHGDPLTDDGTLRFTSFRRTFNGITGSAGAIYNITDRMNVRFNVSRGFRSPNVSELASNGVHEGTVRYETGNVNLKPEYSWQMDLGFDYSSAIVSTQVSLFANRIDNFIFAHKLADADGKEILTDGVPTYQFTAGDARIMGGELSVDVHPVEKLHIENTFSYVNSVQMHQPEASKYLPLTPAPRWMANIRYDIIRDGKILNNTYVSMEMECNLRQDNFYAADNTETATPSYTLLNFAAGTDILHHGRKIASVFLTADNITDRAYQSHLSRLKYTAVNNATGRQGVYNMGRNFGVKVQIPIQL